MQPRRICLLGLAAAAIFFWDAAAQMPEAGADNQQRITPLGQESEPSIFSTHDHRPVDTAPEPSPTPLIAAPGSQAAPPPIPAAPASSPAPLPFATRNPVAPNTYLSGKVPFGHAAPPPPAIPSGPHTTVATPVENVDSVEVSEPAPPTPVPPEADPATQDPTAPTEFTSPIFDGVEDAGGPRKIVLRALNKVTAQATLFKLRPGEMVKFGRLEITALMCRVSAPNSQTDYAGLLDIAEQLPAKEGKKALFRGWMYASSPSIAALEHPVYDVTMVDCEIAAPPKPEPKAEKKPAKNPPKKGKN